MATPFDHLMTDTARLYTWSSAADDFGYAGTETWTDSGTDITGMLQPVTGTTRLVNSVVSQDSTHEYYYPNTYTVDANDRLLIGSITYDVMGPERDYGARKFNTKIVYLKVRRNG